MTEAWHHTFKTKQGDIADMIDVKHKRQNKRLSHTKRILQPDPIIVHRMSTTMASAAELIQSDL